MRQWLCVIKTTSKIYITEVSMKTRAEVMQSGTEETFQSGLSAIRTS